MAAKTTGSPMAAVGEYETVLPFQAVGVKPYIVKQDDSSSVDTVLLELARAGYAVVFVQEAFFLSHSSRIDELNDEYDTSFIPIPGLKGSMGVGLESIRSGVERAVGMDIFAVK
ncbi:MAG: V-type ATP synthase subunit F [Aminobacteriaceae bacterium]